MSALVVLLLVAYFLLLAFALTLWAALTLGDRRAPGAADRMQRGAARRDAPRAGADPAEGDVRVGVADDPRPPVWSPETARALTNDDVRGLRVRERRGRGRGKAAADAPDETVAQNGPVGAAARDSTDRRDGGAQRAASPSPTPAPERREPRRREGDEAHGDRRSDEDRSAEPRSGGRRGDADRNDERSGGDAENERRARGEEAFERFLRAESRDR